jgi:hypothetical protein
MLQHGSKRFIRIKNYPLSANWMHSAHVPSLAAGVALQRAARLRSRLRRRHRATGSRAAAAAKINVQLTPKLGQSGKKARSI